MFGETAIFYVKIWNHPTETTIYTWLFRVPGIHWFFSIQFFRKLFHGEFLSVKHHQKWPFGRIYFLMEEIFLQQPRMYDFSHVNHGIPLPYQLVGLPGFLKHQQFQFRQVVRSWRTASPMELSQLCWSFGLAASAEESQVWGLRFFLGECNLNWILKKKAWWLGGGFKY